jgi:branched-chain amino acid transport system substrate-binding protein
MQSIHGKGLAAVAAVVMAVSMGTAQADTKVGVLLPYSGVFAALGQEIDDGFVFALEQADRAGEFTLIREDTEVRPPEGLAKARKLVLQDEVDLIMGVVSSGVLAALRDFVTDAEVPLLVANAGEDSSTGENCSPYVIRVSFSNSQVNRPMGQWLYDQGHRRVYTLAPDYAAGQQMIATFTAAFEEAGGEIAGAEFTPFGRTQDFGPYITNARAADPDAVFVFYAGSEAIAFVRQYDSFGMKEDIPLFGSGFLTSPLYVGAQGEAAIGVIASLHYVPTIDTPENSEFVEAFRERFDRMPSEYAVQGYDAAQVLMRALDAGADDRASLAREMAQVSYTGPRGPLEIDPATNNIIQNIYVYDTVSDGEGGLTQEVLDVIERVQDEPMGCTLGQ